MTTISLPFFLIFIGLKIKAPVGYYVAIAIVTLIDVVHAAYIEGTRHYED